MKKICLIVSILLLSLLMAFSVGAKCASGCVYSTSPFCDVCGEQIEGECTGSHMFESGYCVICGASDNSMDDWCEVNQGQHNVLYGECTHCGKVYCYHTDLSGLHVVTEPTCKETGYGYRLCLDCGAEYGEHIPQKEHDYKDGVCIACGASSCSHDWFSIWQYSEEPSFCGLPCEQFRDCLRCLNYTEYRTIVSDHKYENGICVYCKAISPDHEHYAQHTVILGDDKHQSICACGFLFDSEIHNYSEVSYTNAPNAYEPAKRQLACEDCGYVRIYCVPDESVYDVYKLTTGERVPWLNLQSYDCLYYEYTSLSAPQCTVYLTRDGGQAFKVLTLPSLKKGEKILIDTKTGYYSIWSDEVKTYKTVIKPSMLALNGNKFDFTPDVGTLPSPLDKFNAYFESDFLDVYNYPAIDYTLRWKDVEYLYPYAVNVTGNIIQLRSFPQSTLDDLRRDVELFPITFVIYDALSQSYNTVKSDTDPFVTMFQRIDPNENGSVSSGSSDVGGAYAQGYADAYNTLTNAVIEKAPFQGFVQGMWYGVLSMVTILGNGISIGGISLFSVLVTVLIICAAYLLLKVIRK